eukprot:Em0004g711a
MNNRIANTTMTDISTLVKSHQMEITGALEDAKEVMTKLTGAIDENNRMIEEVEASKTNAFLAINQAFEVLQQTLEARKKILLSELDAISLSKTTALTLQKEQFEKMVGDIDIASLILQTHTDHEIVALGGLIPTELQATLKRVQTISLTPNQHSNITVSVQTDDLIKQLSKLGNLFESYPSPSSSTWMSTSVARVGTRYHVKGEMRSRTHKGAVVYGEVEDHRDGTYTITLTLKQLVFTSSSSQWMGDVMCVADKGNHRVQKLTSSGKFFLKFGQLGRGQGQFDTPVAVIIDSNDKLIVSDQSNRRLQIFNESGGWLLTIDGKGSGNHSFKSPWGLALDPQGNIHVAAHGSNVIKVFTKEGVYVRMYGDPKHPIGVAIDDEGYSLVSEYVGHCFSIYDPEGNKIHTVGNLKCSDGTALDPRDGSVFIPDYGANNVLKYCV